MRASVNIPGKAGLRTWWGRLTPGSKFAIVATAALLVVAVAVPWATLTIGDGAVEPAVEPESSAPAVSSDSTAINAYRLEISNLAIELDDVIDSMTSTTSELINELSTISLSPGSAMPHVVTCAATGHRTAGGAHMTEESENESGEATPEDEDQQLFLRAAMVSDKYAPVLLQYQSELSRIREETESLQPPAGYEQPRLSLVKACDTLSTGIDEMIGGLKLLKSADYMKISESLQVIELATGLTETARVYLDQSLEQLSSPGS